MVHPRENMSSLPVTRWELLLWQSLSISGATKPSVPLNSIFLPICEQNPKSSCKINKEVGRLNLTRIFFFLNCKISCFFLNICSNQFYAPKVIVANISGFDIKMGKTTVIHVLQTFQTRVCDERQDVFPTILNVQTMVSQIDQTCEYVPSFTPDRPVNSICLAHEEYCF